MAAIILIPACLIFIVQGTAFGFILHTINWRCPHLHTGNHMYFYKSRCYEFVLKDTEYWDDARDICRKKGGELAIIPDVNTQSFLYNTLRSLHQDSSVWIGLSDLEHESDWKWTDGSSLHGYENWGSGQGHGFLHSLWDCAIMKVRDGGKWHDLTCHTWPEDFGYICQYSNYGYICQYNAFPVTSKSTRKSTTTPTQSTVPSTSSSTPTISTASTSTKATTTSTAPATYTKPITSSTSPSTTTACTDIDCQQECTNGYSGIFVAPDGCIKCRCNH